LNILIIGLVLVILGYLAALVSEATRIGPERRGFPGLPAFFAGVFRERRRDYTAYGWTFVLVQRAVLVIVPLLLIYWFLEQ
jgi:hypothetical protein